MAVAHERIVHDETLSYAWRRSFNNTEINQLHAEAIETRLFGNDEWDWSTRFMSTHRETDQHGTFEPSGDDRNAGGDPSQGRATREPRGEASEW